MFYKKYSYTFVLCFFSYCLVNKLKEIPAIYLVGIFLLFIFVNAKQFFHKFSTFSRQASLL